MALFGKSKQVLRRAWKRLLDAFRFSFGAVRVFHIVPGVKNQEGDQLIPLPVTDQSAPMLEEMNISGADGTLKATIVDARESLKATVREVQPPESITADVHTVVTSVGRETGALELSFSPPPSTIRKIEKGLLIPIALKAFKPSGVDAAVRTLPIGSAAATVKSGMNRLSTYPVVRTSLSMQRLPTEARVAYWRELIDQTGKTARDLELIGVFPNVPVKGVNRARIDSSRGELKIWLDTDAGTQRAGVLLIARERATGTIHRVFDRRSIAGRF